jgi:hypothetical protein
MTPMDGNDTDKPKALLKLIRVGSVTLMSSVFWLLPSAVRCALIAVQ